MAEKAGDYMSLTLTDPVTLAACNPVEKAKQQHNILTKQKPLLQIRITLEMLTERLLVQTLINKVLYCVTVGVWACTYIMLLTAYVMCKYKYFKWWYATLSPRCMFNSASGVRLSSHLHLFI